MSLQCSSIEFLVYCLGDEDESIFRSSDNIFNENNDKNNGSSDVMICEDIQDKSKKRKRSPIVCSFIYFYEFLFYSSGKQNFNQKHQTKL